jgi:hypothetical protein
MGNKDSLKPLKELPSNLCYAFSPFYRIEALTGIAGYGIIIDGAIKGSSQEVLGGLVVSALSGLYGAYKDGCFSKNRNSNDSNLESKTNKESI